MEAIILILIIGSFAWWCFSQGSKTREKTELEKRKEVEAWSEDMYRRYIDKDVELSKPITPSAKSTARSEASRTLSDPAPSPTRPGPPTAAPSTTNLRRSEAKPLTPDEARRIAAYIPKR